MSLSDDDLDLLADLLAGEGSDEQVARVAASPELAQALADLEQAQQRVAQDLAGLAAEDVAPPAGFAERLTAALAAEPGPPERQVPSPAIVPDRTSDADTDSDSDPVPLEAARARRAHARPQRSPWILRAAAGCVALVAVAGIGLATTQGDGDSGDLSAASTAGQVPTTASGRDYRDTGSLSAALPTLLGRVSAGGSAPRGTAAPQSQDALTGGTATGGEAPEVAASASTGGSTGGTGQGAPALPSSPLAADSSGPDPAALDRLREPAGLQACYAALELAPDTSPLALDYASWQGAPALVLLLPVAAQPTQVEAYVVGAGCGTGTDALLFFGRLDRP